METTRRNLLTGLAALPAAVPSNEPAKLQGDVITQVELEALRQMHMRLDLVMHSLEWRLWSGATVELGAHHAKWVGEGVGCRPGDEEARPNGFVPCGGTVEGRLEVEWGKRTGR